MRYLLIAFLGFFSILSAGDFEEAEKLFQQEKFQACDAVIERALEKGSSPAQKIKLRAMREYILSNDPEKIAQSVRQAQATAAHYGWLSTDLLTHSSLMIRRAEYWKSRGIPEFQDLSDAAGKLLKQLKDGGNPEITLKSVILQTKNYNLNGEFNEPIKLIQNVLRMYYPHNRYGKKEKSSGEIELLILLGEQYAGLGAGSRDEREKVSALSQCAHYYLRAIEGLSTDSTRYWAIADRLCFCREALRLLGYELQLPTRIKPKRAIVLAMIDEMLREGRFQDVVIALENRPAPAMRLRYAVALSAIGQTSGAVTVFQKIVKISEPNWVLQAARHSLAYGKDEEAAVLFQLFLKLSPRSIEAIYASRQYSALLLKQKKYADAANIFLLQAGLASDAKDKTDAFFQAARCLYLAEEYQKCIDLFARFSPHPEHNLLLTQAYIRANCIKEAYNVLTCMLASKTLSAENQYRAMKLAVLCAMKISPPEAIKRLELFLNMYPQDSITLEYAKQLLHLYAENKAEPPKFERLANVFLKQGDIEAVFLVLACVEHISDVGVKEKILRKLLARDDFSVRELNVLLKQLPTLALKRDFIQKYKKEFANTPDICELYYQIAKIEYASSKYDSTLSYLEHLLSQQKTFKYVECKKLQIAANVKLGREQEVRKSCQELLLTKLSAAEKRNIVLSLAQSWERTGEYKKAIASAWTVTPLDGRCVDAKDQLTVKALLALIIHNAEKIGSPSDLQDAQELFHDIAQHTSPTKDAVF